MRHSFQVNAATRASARYYPCTIHFCMEFCCGSNKPPRVQLTPRLWRTTPIIHNSPPPHIMSSNLSSWGLLHLAGPRHLRARQAQSRSYGSKSSPSPLLQWFNGRMSNHLNLQRMSYHHNNQKLYWFQVKKKVCIWLFFGCEAQVKVLRLICTRNIYMYIAPPWKKKSYLIYTTSTFILK
jgi:hypothetical protein